MRSFSRAQNNSHRTGVVILGGDFQALGAVRSLAERGVPVILIDDEPNIARYSRYLNSRIRMTRLRESHLFAQRLIALAKDNDLLGWMLLPNNDELLMFLAKNKEILSQYYSVPVPTWEIARKYYYKDEAYEVAQRVSVPIPKRYVGKTPEDVLDQSPVFPLVLKPRAKERYYPRSRKKGIKVNNPAELRREHSIMASIIDPSEIVVQEFLPGGGKNLFSYATLFDGQKIIAGMAANRLRQHPREFGHATTYAISANIPELKDLSERILREMGFYGIAEVEFMKDDREGIYKFIEVNGRIWGWHTLVKAAGLNLPYMLYQHVMGIQPEHESPEIGVKWVRLITDVPLCAQEILSGRLGLREYLRSMSRPLEFAVLSKRDPLPFFVEFALIPYLWWKRGF